jgi:hypothetical protein
MKKLKAVITALLLVGSWVSLACAYAAVSGVLRSYTATYPTTFGSHVPAFSKSAISVMSGAPVICLSSFLISAVLTMLIMWRSKNDESKLYWITVLGSVNYYLASFLTSTVLIGFFMLPKLANAV